MNIVVLSYDYLTCGGDGGGVVSGFWRVGGEIERSVIMSRRLSEEDEILVEEIAHLSLWQLSHPKYKDQ